MLSKFRTYQLAVELYRVLKKSDQLPYDLKDQLLRASSSTVLNLAEGSAKALKKRSLAPLRTETGTGTGPITDY